MTDDKVAAVAAAVSAAPPTPPDYATALLSSLTISVIIPLFILLMLVIAGWILLARAQKNQGFEISDVLKDENGRVSTDKLTLLGTWAASTWALSVVVFALPQYFTEAFLTYLGCWAVTGGAKSFFAHKYGGVAPTNPPSGQPFQPGQ